MKNTLIILGSLLIANSASAQKVAEKDVPVKVKEAFSKKYPNTKAEWEKEGVDYEAEFDLNKTESSAVFNADGMFKELEQEIKKAELPLPVSEYCAANYKEYKIEEAAKITDASGKVMYEAEMSKGKEHFDAVFDDKGNFIRRSAPQSAHEKSNEK